MSRVVENFPAGGFFSRRAHVLDVEETVPPDGLQPNLGRFKNGGLCSVTPSSFTTGKFPGCLRTVQQSAAQETGGVGVGIGVGVGVGVGVGIGVGVGVGPGVGVGVGVGVGS